MRRQDTSPIDLNYHPCKLRRSSTPCMASRLLVGYESTTDKEHRIQGINKRLLHLRYNMTSGNKQQ